MMILTAKGDPAKLEEMAAGRGELLAALSSDAKSRGAIHHTFYGTVEGDTIMVLDEWDSPDSFHAFFAAHPEIGEMMGEVGVTEQPNITFWRKLDTSDAF